MKILLAVDDSEFSKAAVQTVVSQNRPEQTEIMVLNVLEPLAALFPALHAGAGYYPLSPEDYDRLEKEFSGKAAELVARIAETLRSAGFRAEPRVQEGVTRTSIVDMAADWKADLIVLGAHGRRGLERLLLGSVSDFVARHAKCSVEIVRMPAGKAPSDARN